VKAGKRNSVMTHVFEIRTYGPDSYELIIDGKRVQLDFLSLDVAMLHADFIALDLAKTRQRHETTKSLEFAPVSRRASSVEIRRATLVLPDLALNGPRKEPSDIPSGLHLTTTLIMGSYRLRHLQSPTRHSPVQQGTGAWRRARRPAFNG
jgi:hypothetical protein